MKSSESIKNITVALLKAQRSMGSAKKDSKNPYFKSSYADYGSVLEASKDPLNENGILVLQPHFNRNEKNFVETVLIHESGEWMSSETEVVCAKQNDPQALGSAITYARRYGLQSLLSMPAEDDDGNAAMNRSTKTVTTTPLSKTTVLTTSTPTSGSLTTSSVPATKTETTNVVNMPTSEAKKPGSFKDRIGKKATPATGSDNGGF